MDEDVITGQDVTNVDEMILCMIHNGPVQNSELCQAIMKRADTGRATYYRHKKVLETEGLIESYRSKGRLYIRIKGGRHPAVSPPSRVDELLRGECERLVTDLMASGLTNPIEINPASPSPEAIVLLRRCSSVYDSLKWLEARREMTLPERWPHPTGGRADQKAWARYQRVWFECAAGIWDASPPAMMSGIYLHNWLIFLLEVIDLMDRELGKQSEKKAR